ncbi:TorD/DmsD family molecular chaperone [Halodesulfurarchaeum sp.]|uniref:TorD/DmsD family molecular chaperone n=1 Tax=Halodesulfurarchaeum sp. TaxID=1980530 RepID=UPI001BBF6C8B|nr:molecular chaperone TorD family protein [Halodesulfurarchaeum sp.]
MNDSTIDEDHLATERRRGNTYKLLAELLRQPDEEVLGLLEETEETELAVDPAALRAVETDLQTMRVDHAKLFVGPYELQAPPYESAYLHDDGRVATETTNTVQTTFLQEGFDIDMDEPADHVVAELEFMYVLVLREVEALASGNEAEAVSYIEKQDEFFSVHLDQWIDEFAAKVRQNAETDFYEQLGAALKRFVGQERPVLSGRIARLENGESLPSVLSNPPLATDE